MPRTISAQSTPVLKFVLPPVCAVLFGVAAYALWSDGTGLAFRALRATMPVLHQWLLLAVSATAAVSAFGTCPRLKRVQLTDAGLRVSNYFAEADIPFRAIERVSQGRWHPVRPVTIWLRSDNRFGERITFVPVPRSRLAFWREDEVVADLRALAHSGGARLQRPSAALDAKEKS
jgi:hypothetical protein